MVYHILTLNYGNFEFYDNRTVNNCGIKVFLLLYLLINYRSMSMSQISSHQTSWQCFVWSFPEMLIKGNYPSF